VPRQAKDAEEGTKLLEKDEKALHEAAVMGDSTKVGRLLPWREAGPPNHHDDKVDSDQ